MKPRAKHVNYVETFEKIQIVSVDMIDVTEASYISSYGPLRRAINFQMMNSHEIIIKCFMRQND